MAAIRLDRAHLNAVADLNDGVSFATSGRSFDVAQAGEVRVYAGGRKRVVTRPLKTRTFGLTAVRVPGATLSWLNDHAGQLLLFRDHRGRRYFVTYFGLGIEDVKIAPLFNVTLQLQEITHQEAV